MQTLEQMIEEIGQKYGENLSTNLLCRYKYALHNISVHRTGTGKFYSPYNPSEKIEIRYFWHFVQEVIRIFHADSNVKIVNNCEHIDEVMLCPLCNEYLAYIWIPGSGILDICFTCVNCQK